MDNGQWTMNNPQSLTPSVLSVRTEPSAGSILGWDSAAGQVEVALGRSRIGLEERVADGGLDWTRALRLVEELCGPCSQANTLAFAQAVEDMALLIVPTRAAYLRLALAEMERVTSHLLNAAETFQAL